MTVLGVDPGSRKFGWAVVQQRGKLVQRLAGGVVRLNGELPERLGEILTNMTALLDAHVVQALAIESAFVHANPRTALVLGQARGVPIALAAARSLPVFEYAPAAVKRAIVGSGRAEKHQMQHMIAATLGLTDLPAEDEADALAIAVMHLRQQTFAGQARPSVKIAAAAPLMTPARAAYLQAVNQAKATRRSR